MNATSIKERPIIFSPEMVRAILEGRKTMTRRVIKVPKWSTPCRALVDYGCPYIGEKLYVKETFACYEDGIIPSPIL